MTDLPSLGELLAVVTPAGGVVGGLYGLLFLSAATNRQLVENVLLGAGIGGVAGSAASFLIAGGVAAGQAWHPLGA